MSEPIESVRQRSARVTQLSPCEGAISRGPLRGGSALCAGLAAYHEGEPGKCSATPQLDAICKCLPAMRPIIVGWTVQNIFVDPASK